MTDNCKAVIFVVDNEMDSPVLKPLLENLNKKYTVLASRTVEDAERLFKYDTESIDFVLLDIHFGNDPLGGMRLLETIRKTDSDLPIGMITQYDEAPRAFESGKKLATFYLPKPKEGISNEFLTELGSLIEDSLKEAAYIYDRGLMKNCNSKLADIYDKDEYSKPGTVAFCHWEDERVIEALDAVVNQTPTEKLKVLDVGCGTGRFELLIRKYLKEKGVDYEIVALDFSGKMLARARQKIEDNLDDGEIPPEPADTNDIPKIRLQRGSAENLPFRDKSFDFVIAGFGIPSYTKFNLTIPGIYKLLEDNGMALFTVYNRKAFFHKIFDHFFPDKVNQCPMASTVIVKWFDEKQEQGMYYLAPQGRDEDKFPIQTFTQMQLSDVLNRFNFKVESISTFPVLYSIYPISHVAQLAKTDTGEATFPMIYKSQGLFFSKELYELDKEYAGKIGDGGYYITAIARKR